jgi:methanogenic corrinoid protein MtbC1/DNA-binding XRE family transcriptional regulator
MPAAANRYGRAAQWRKQYLKALTRGDEDTARRIIEGLARTAVPLQQIYLSVLRPAQIAVGELWSQGKLNVAQEKLATQITLTQMERLRFMTNTTPSRKQHALISSVQDEQHYVGAKMVANLLALDGWHVDFLGADVPTKTLLELIRKRRPDMVGLSVTMADHLTRLGAALNGIGRLTNAPKIVVGGQALKQRRNAALPRDIIAADASEAVVRATQWLQLHPRAASLPDYLTQVGRRIRELRNHNNLTQQQLADTTRLTRAYIVAVESGKQNVTVDVLLRIANALGVTPDRLLAPEEVPGEGERSILEES